MMKLSLAVVALLAATTAGNAQPKFGYVNSQEIILSMPEIQDVQLSLEKLQKEVEEQLEIIMVEYNNKLVDYQKNQANYSDAIRQSKEQELMSLQQRYEELSKAASQVIPCRASRPELHHPPALFAFGVGSVLSQSRLIYLSIISDFSDL